MESSSRFLVQQLIWLIAPLIICHMSELSFGCLVDDCSSSDQLDSNDRQVLMDAEAPVNLPNALNNWHRIVQTIGKRPVAICLDYDGTLTPHVPNPDEAFIGEEMKSALGKLAKQFQVSIITGRPLKKIRGFLSGIDNLFFAANHGLDITFDDNDTERIIVAQDYVPHLEEAYSRLKSLLGHIGGCIVENNILSVSVHYRNVENQKDQDLIKRTVLKVCEDYKSFIRITDGAKVWELRPSMDWDKGKALDYILKERFKDPDTIAFYIGDDTTDEDAFKVVRARSGVSILVNRQKPTAAEYVVPFTNDVLEILKRLSDFALSQKATQ